jgi:hypothetical protein
MSLPKFGELKLTKTSSLDEETNNENYIEHNLNSFSIIDLNTGVQSPNSKNNNLNSSYTSFGEAIHSNQSENVATNISTNNINTSQQFITSSASNSFNSSLNGRNSPSSSILSSASDVSSRIASRTASTFETFKQWSKSAYKCTRQIVSEKLGKSSRTVDPELDLIIEVILWYLKFYYKIKFYF